MRIGIIVAMEKELRLLLPLIDNVTVRELDNGVTLHEGKIGRHDIAAVQCGIGKVNSAIVTYHLTEHFHPELVINTGVAGGADPSMHVLDLFVASAVAYHDTWCGPGTAYGAAHGFDQLLLPYLPLVEMAVTQLPADKLKCGLICSGDKFITTAEEIREIKSHFPECLAVDMESASIAQVCTMSGIPFNIIRVISDTPGQEENISQYENFWTDAPVRTFEALKILLEKL